MGRIGIAVSVMVRWSLQIFMDTRTGDIRGKLKYITTQCKKVIPNGGAHPFHLSHSSLSAVSSMVPLLTSILQAFQAMITSP